MTALKIVIDEWQSLLIIKGLAAYMLFGNPTQKEKNVIIEVFNKLEFRLKGEVKT